MGEDGKAYTRVYARIDLDAVEENMKAMQAVLAGGACMIGVVKADGYGHGAVPVAKTIDPYVAGYATATIEEARNLQKHGITKPILILGATHPSRSLELAEHGIRPAIFTMEQALAMSKAAAALFSKAGAGENGISGAKAPSARSVRPGAPSPWPVCPAGRVPVHLAVDTGMSRIGMSCDENGAKLAAAVAGLPGIFVEGIFTHFARADEADGSAALRQWERYRHFLEAVRAEGVTVPVRHIANSAGIIGLPGTHCDMVRAGISIYGMYPSDEVERDRVRLRPVLSLHSFVTYVKEIPIGAEVSYGGTFKAEKPVKVATVPVGYGDGYPRNLSGKGSVLIRGRRAPVLGRVCMDQLMADVTDIPDVRVDDPVTLIGRDGEACVTVEELARIGGGFHYEIVCDIGKRVPRVYVRGGRVVGTKDYFDDRYEDFG